MLYVDAHTSRDKGLRLPNGTQVATVQDLIPGCANYPLWSLVPNHKVLNAMIDHVNIWIQGGPAAPPGISMQRVSGNPAQLLYSGAPDWRTFGGVRLAEYDYPTAFTLGGANQGPGFCFAGGHHRFYDKVE